MGNTLSLHPDIRTWLMVPISIAFAVGIIIKHHGPDFRRNALWLWYDGGFPCISCIAEAPLGYRSLVFCSKFHPAGPFGLLHLHPTVRRSI